MSIGRSSSGAARRAAIIISIAVAALAIGAQFVPVARTNPPATAPLEAPPEVSAILGRACADCHSNATRWPWYSRVAPVSWFVTKHVREGRANLNFSYWGGLDAKERGEKAKAVVDQLAAGAMPLRSYRIAHREARLTPADRRVLQDWFAGPGPRGAGGAAQNVPRVHGGLDDDDLQER